MDSKTNRPDPWDVVKVGDYILIKGYKDSINPYTEARNSGRIGLVIDVTKAFSNQIKMVDFTYIEDETYYDVLMSDYHDTFEIITEEQAKSEAFQKTMRAFYGGSED